MDIYTTRDLPSVWETLGERLRGGEVGILPTDTIYGISGNALDADVVRRIHRIKGKRTPSSFIPHSIDWARLIVEDGAALFSGAVSEYSGAFTMFWKYCSRWATLPEELVSSGLAGLRFPRHWITDLAAAARIPIITTSVNRHKRPYMTSLDDLPPSIRRSVDFIVYEGPLHGPPSTLVHCEQGRPFPMEERS
jgi:L-threonylcarbamoyladenylate synthase